MFRTQGIMATTHRDRHGDKLTLDALKSIVGLVQQSYIPLGVEHDPRNPPVGRFVSAELIELPDGEWGVLGTIEVFKGEDPRAISGDGRKINIRVTDSERFTTDYDISFLNPEGKKLIQELEELSGETPHLEFKKALEPISLLMISAGIFALGSVAAGFFNKLGADVYDTLKTKLKNHFTKKNNVEENLLCFSFSLKQDDRHIEVLLVLVNTTPEVIETVFHESLKELDKILQDIPIVEYQIARVVFQYDDGLKLLYVVRDDVVPLTLSKAP